ncbi:MAG TPA: antitoxin Xre-like helix-turn-helix domain-containing protein [Mucilaginibacter sp.]|jgi:putative toxin-antitoxin system antitoxin component (TIGR02293 family)
MFENTATDLKGKSRFRSKFKGLSIENDAQIFSQAKAGLSSAIFYEFARLIKMPDKTLANLLHLSPRTISNYHEKHKSFEPVQSEHLLKLIALYDKGEDIFGNIDEFSYWLNKPFWDSEEKPVDWLITPGGVDLVMLEIDRLAYGYPA